MKKQQFILTIKAEYRPGLLHLITGIIEKRQAEIKSLNAAQTDIHDIILVTIEIEVAESNLTSLALKLENIIEVFSVEASQFNQVVCLRAAYFKMAKAFLDTPKVSVLQNHNALIVNWYPDAFLLAHHGSDVTVRELYNQLDGPHLLGFSQTGLISDSSLINHEDEERVMTDNGYVINEERISRLAA
jgi:acetolactate synthase small subunit